MRPLQPIHAPGLVGRTARVSDLRKAGVRRWRIYASDVSHPLHGVVGAPGVDPDAFAVGVEALRTIMRPGWFISRRTAAKLYALPVDGSDRTFDVGAIRPVKPPERRTVRGHQLGRSVLRSIPAAPTWLPHPADVWGLLAPVCSLEELVVAGDFAVSGASRTSPPLCSVQDLAETVLRFTRHTGVGGLSAALPLLRTGVESPAESRTRLLIVQAGYPMPQTSCPVRVRGRLFHADLGYPELRIAIEYEGEYHFTGGVERARRDNSRAEAMRDAGWTVLKLTAIDLRDPRDFLARLGRAIAAATALRG